jgi:GDPmannose 4,6-dehydratase/GDP-4-dehydro-6-deoxy-D-mannose reductase
MKALITGITGSGASYLAEYLLSHTNVEVHGVSRWHSTATAHNLREIKDDVVLHECDLNDLSATYHTIKDVKPDYVFHLAAHANVKVCFSNPIAVLQNNTNNTINLFEAIRMVGIDPIIQNCMTSEVYRAASKDECPISETHPVEPQNIYAVSKLTQEKIGLAYFHSYGFKVITTRMFSYINPRRKDIFATAFAKQIIDIERSNARVLKHGNLKPVRTLIDVRDAMSSYWVASQKCHVGQIYNIGGDNTISIGEFLELLKTYTKANIITEEDKSLLRPVDISYQIPDCTKFINQTGWYPNYTLDESIMFLLDHLRQEQ